MNNDSLEEYQVYCHMTEIPGCGSGGWTLVMKINGTKVNSILYSDNFSQKTIFLSFIFLSPLFQTEFNYFSTCWSNKEIYAVKDGLEGLTEKQTKLASYWNTPFDKICLGMKVNGVTKWIVINRQATSLFNVIADEDRKDTTAGKDPWRSLMDSSLLDKYCNREGFNIRRSGYYS